MLNPESLVDELVDIRALADALEVAARRPDDVADGTLSRIAWQIERKAKAALHLIECET